MLVFRGLIRENNMKLNLKQKMELIKQGKAYVAKCDGAFFLYLKVNETEIVKRLTKKDFEELEWYEWQIESEKRNQIK